MQILKGGEKRGGLGKAGQLSIHKSGRHSIVYPILLQLEDPVHVPFRGGEAAVQNAWSPKLSRPPEPQRSTKIKGNNPPRKKQARGSTSLKRKRKERRKQERGVFLRPFYALIARGAVGGGLGGGEFQNFI